MSDARNTDPPTALATRMLELVDQSRRYQARLAKISEEIEQLKAKIDRMAPQPNDADEAAA